MTLRMEFKIKAYSLQELGQRKNQEDSLYPSLGKQTDNNRVFILCDGMGGHEKGEVASSTVCEVMGRTIRSLWNPSRPLTDDIFQLALSAAYDALDAKDNGEERKMGTTMTFLCLHAGGATVAHIGDSRIYQLRPAKDGTPARIVFRTRDHSLVSDLVRIGEITEEEAKHHPQKNVITRAMQPCQEQRAKADITHLTDIQSGDYFYMCSDGMLEEATDENILNIITKPDAPNEQKLEMLRRVTEDNKDNHTAHLIYIDKVEGAVVPTAQSSQPKDTQIIPEHRESATRTASPQPAARPTKKRGIFPLIALAVVITAIAVAAMRTGKGDGKAVQIDTTEVSSSKQAAGPKELVRGADKQAEKADSVNPSPPKTADSDTKEVSTTKKEEAVQQETTSTLSSTEEKFTPDSLKKQEATLNQPQ